MRAYTHNRTIAAVLALAFLAGCAAEDASREAEPAPEGAASESPLSQESLVMAETAWLSVSEAGEVFTTYLDPDGRYRDERGGQVVYGGTWEQNPNRELCFTPDSGEGACWAHGAPGLDGVMRATSGQGRAIEAKKVVYTAPAILAEEAQATEDAGGETGDGADTPSDNSTDDRG